MKAKQSLFLRQFAYRLWVAGQIAVIFHTVDLMNHILPILFLQLAMLALAYFMRTHWFFVFVQILGLYAAGVACIWDINAHLRLAYIV